MGVCVCVYTGTQVRSPATVLKPNSPTLSVLNERQIMLPAICRDRVRPIKPYFKSSLDI